ncbi:MAG TPA: 30S ribosome-binding factor RbfA [Candidatus Omnitrophota bacterium]|jgi:ribosome-binding factor A|nr:MAG: Ribosome-binding factor A [Candidatus Omnitrophica bacterium ADurb.Bin314]HOE69094.1 30S ribosome-binding factor RbfA [Candidatus Omnitrophota bacterium]HPW64681.1 30S ribosome-binding factor RbfA [Candidatus Omnitrophota bacterium]HQB93634.1 30S ribosome-binding factor RbfA [Candidatus Omnitrophota bacterium]
MQGKRTERVGSLLQMELGKLILERVKDPRLGFVTLTHVKVTADLKSAVVFFTVMGDAAKRKDSLDVLRRAAGFLQREVGKTLTMRYTPHLQFELDDMVDKSFEIEALIRKIENPPTGQ